MENDEELRQVEKELIEDLVSWWLWTMSFKKEDVINRNECTSAKRKSQGECEETSPADLLPMELVMTAWSEER